MQIITEYTELKDVEIIRIAYIQNGAIAYQTELRFDRVNNGKNLRLK